MMMMMLLMMTTISVNNHESLLLSLLSSLHIITIIIIIIIVTIFWLLNCDDDDDQRARLSMQEYHQKVRVHFRDVPHHSGLETNGNKNRNQHNDVQYMAYLRTNYPHVHTLVRTSTQV